MIEIKELSEQNFNHFLNLLLERGEAPEDFYKWKYLQQPINNFPTGFIAYFDGIPLGCIGIINKIYIDQHGYKNPATWFADWFVSNAARGKGIGLALMKKVYALSPYAFGIPGPQKAQIVAQKAGYKIQNHFNEIIIPCQPFWYGFKKYESGFIKSTLRGFKNLWQCGMIFQDNSVEILALHNTENVSSSITRKNSFYQTVEYIDWLIKMPVKEENQRKWYKVSDNNSWMIIFVEDDANNNKRARVIDDYNIEKKDRIHFLKKTRKKLAQIDVLYLQAYLFSGTKPLIASDYLKPIAQSASFHISDFTIAIIDMESRWRDFKMK